MDFNDIKNSKPMESIKELHLLRRGKKRLLKLIYGRIILIIAVILLEFYLLFRFYIYVDKTVRNVYELAAVLTVITVLHLFNNRMDPSVKLTWLLIILAAHPVGSLIYWYVMSDWGHRDLKRRIQKILRLTEKSQPDTPETMEAVRRRDPQSACLAQYLMDHGGYHPYPASDLTYYPSGAKFLEDFLLDLERAKHFIFLEYFIVDEGEMWGRILYVLTQKAKEGVEVRLMYDGLNEFKNLPHSYPKKLAKLGIQCRIFDPIHPIFSTEYNYRDHRKIAVIDGKTAYTGGVNFADEYINAINLYGYWKDVAIRTHGEGVATFTRLFLEMWNYKSDRPMPEENHYIESSSLYGLFRTKGGQRIEEADTLAKTEGVTRREVHAAIDNIISDGFIIPYADNPLDHEKTGEQVYMDIFNTAKEYVHVMTPYLILDSSMNNSIMYAAKRGVEVSLILPHHPDKRYAFVLAKAHYRELIEAGVHIYEFKPGFVHAKVFVSDGHKATVGSINLDYRSLYHHFEDNLYIDGNPVVDDIERDFQETLASCEEITLEKYRHGGFLNALDKIVGTIFKLGAPLF